MAVEDTSDLLGQAVRLHQQGRLEAAQALYRRVLDLNPRQFDALHLLGVIERQRGHPGRAVDLIEEALRIDPLQARAHCNLGAALQDLGRTDAALASYEAALRLDPAYALAWDNRGNTLRRLGRLAEALDSYERALGINPALADAWCHRAIALHDLGRHADAVASAEQALATRPAYADAFVALGHALQALDRHADGIDAYGCALALAPQADTWCAHGTALKKSGDLAGALHSYERALALRPDYALAEHYRANTLRALGQRDAAVASYRRALDLGADAVEIRFALAALGEAEQPAAAPADYVKHLFDQYAGRFDRHLVDVLGYRTPALLDALLRPHLAALPVDAALDLGCGTGLCAPFLRPLARHVTGVDLSQKMLEKAAGLDLYDDLICADIVAWLAERPASCDLAVAADVLVYLGDLSPLFARVRRALRAGGLFAFSCEALDDGRDHAILPSNRFAHALDYVTRTARAAGFDVVATERAVLRQDHGRDVGGHLVLVRAA
ncbi:tetratricopeptide repeat protein [Telluria mixta]|uniref:Tetratricopeptide repeat protein n=1 Tax=Telluria mixta TaxID=34071 RepID=A0ABT2BS93_9BURK|nr:tetratricopeptide repeat protein [Telluria mixta]MCS0627987.1 tetratricopeptide repeat protein [Telluria mixta]WEM93894.1 tetratricopeptide repeat protein [Telluria mixta]